MAIDLDVVEGVHRIEHAYTNAYLIVDGDRVTLVDAGFPSTWQLVRRCLAAVGRTPADIDGLVLTHGHFDHVGFARPLQHWLGVPVWVHPSDRRLAAHPYRYRPQQNRVLFPLLHPGGLPVLASMVRAGALTVRGVAADEVLIDHQVLPLPGSPTVRHVPGHTEGQCVLHLPDRGAVLSGDALVTLDPYTGRRGPRLVAPAATMDMTLARRSLDVLGELDASVLLPGHGAVWNSGVGAAVDMARRK